MIKIDLMSNKYFTDGQVNKLLQTHIRTRVSQEDELKAARLARGTPTAEQQAFINKIDNHIADCITAAQQLRIDSDLLASTIAYESALIRTAQPALDPKAVDADGNLVYPLDDKGINQAIETDKANRANAQVIVDTATVEVKDLATQRKPKPVEVPKDPLDLTGVINGISN